LPAYDNFKIKSLPFSFIDRKQRAILFRKAKKGDYKKILKMYQDFEPKESYQGLPPSNPEKLQQWVNLMMNNAFNIIGMSFDKRVICHGSIFEIDKDRSEFILAVFPEFQNAGIGMNLTRMIKSVSKELGFEKIWLCVEPTNMKAKHIYRKLGFETTSMCFGEESEMCIDLECDPALLAKVSSIMTGDVFYLTQDKTAREAVDIFLKLELSGMPVVDENHKLVGFITETDLLESWTINRNVSEIMTRNVYFVYQHDVLSKITDIICKYRIKQIPVVNKKKKLVGIIGRKNIIRHLHDKIDKNKIQ
jgi:CBS domain-containing protein/GNAT superfamily N-acetyltransferase